MIGWLAWFGILSYSNILFSDILNNFMGRENNHTLLTAAGGGHRIKKSLQINQNGIWSDFGIYDTWNIRHTAYGSLISIPYWTGARASRMNHTLITLSPALFLFVCLLNRHRRCDLKPKQNNELTSNEIKVRQRFIGFWWIFKTPVPTVSRCQQFLSPLYRWLVCFFSVFAVFLFHLLSVNLLSVPVEKFNAGLAAGWPTQANYVAFAVVGCLWIEHYFN